MSKDNIVSNTRPNDEESSFILEKNINLLSKEPRMTEERQKEVLCDASGRREAVNQDNDGVAYPTISSEAEILSQDVKEHGEVGDCSTSSGVDPPSKKNTSTEPTDSKQLLKPTKSDLDDEVTDKDSDKPMTGSSYSTREAWQRLEDELTQFLSLDTEIQDRSNTCLVAGAYEIDDIDSASDIAADISFLPTRKSSLSQRLLNLAPQNNDGMESETNDGEDGELPAKGSRH